MEEFIEEFSYEIKIPKERVAVLIGKKGEIKKSIEEATNSKIGVDSKEGEVTITGEDSLGMFTAREVIKAIARGFNPDVALLLLKQDYVFEIVNISDYTGKSKSKIIRMKGRVIGSEGKTRKVIEELTETHLSVYGKTICIIGTAENAINARKAIESLLEGAQHSSIYKWLEKKRRESKIREMTDDSDLYVKDVKEAKKGSKRSDKNKKKSLE